MKSLLMFALITFANYSFGAEFDGPWMIEKNECNDHDALVLQANQGTAKIPQVSCYLNSKWVLLTASNNPDSIEIEFFDDKSQSYNHRTFHCLKTSVLNFPEGLCAGYHYGREGVLFSGKEKEQVLYTESKIDDSPEGVGSYQYSFKLEKVSFNKYKMSRHLRFILRPPYVQDVTQVLFLTR